MEFFRRTGSRREEWILQNLDFAPSWCKPSVDIQVGPLVFRVAPDYWGVHSESYGFLRLPMRPKTAQQIADKFEWILPNKRLVEIIWSCSRARIPAVSCSTDRNGQAIEKINEANEQSAKATTRDVLVAGHRKDIVLTNALDKAKGKVAIFGWHGTTGRAIQPLSTIHSADYVDYSHGARFLAASCTLWGQPASMHDVLKMRDLAPMLSHEGALTKTRYT